MHTHITSSGDLEAAIQIDWNDQRTATLRRVTDLLLAHADRLSEEQIGIFDDAFGHLTKGIGSKVLAELSGRLAPVENAPPEIVRRLARDEDIAVAGPVLAQSARLTTGDLVEIAKTKSQAHLLASAGRALLGEFVTDALLQHGDRDVVCRLASNTDAGFSEVGVSTLVQRAETDEGLAEKVGPRLDIPLQLFRRLLLRATEVVQSRLLAVAPAERQAETRRVLSLFAKKRYYESLYGSKLDNIG